ncbi:hypothetical protein BU15DRAFT_45398 [Melanogaster broomeanus]|nr:hypothetical protein BU15DRAFT_45398 [Melanogaster broomeanus]
MHLVYPDEVIVIRYCTAIKTANSDRFTLPSIAFCLDLIGHVQWNDLCPDYEALGSAKVLLDAGRHSGRITRDGNFSVPDVDAGTYILSMSSHDYAFDQVRVDIPDSSQQPEIKSYMVGTPLTSLTSVSLPYPVVLTPRHKNKYFKPRESFNLFGMFQNPMMMIMLLTGVMMLAMPYIMTNLDPQTLEELKGHRGQIANLQNSIQNGDIKSGYVDVILLGAHADCRRVDCQRCWLPRRSRKASASGVKPPVNGLTTQQRKVGKGNKRR